MKRYKIWKANRRLQQARRILNAIDKTMLDAGFTRAERRCFWNDLRAGRVKL